MKFPTTIPTLKQRQAKKRRANPTRLAHIKERKRSTIDVDGVFDIETADWTEFVMGGLLLRDGTYLHFDWFDEEKFVDTLLSFKGRLWAHNGGKFDLKWLLKHILKRNERSHRAIDVELEVDDGDEDEDPDQIPVTLHCGGDRVTTAKIGQHLHISDSYALIPMSLEKAAHLGDYRKSKTGLSCVCGQGCGGYCAIRTTLPDLELQRMRDYLRNDCRATLSMLTAVVNFSERNNLDLANTIGSSSWKAAQRWLGLGDADWSWGRRKAASTLFLFCRGGYFGGRTQVLQPFALDVWRYDINSSYPAALKFALLPWGKPAELVGQDAEDAFADGKAGIYEVTIDVPEMHIPPLPMRGELRLSYPWGELRGTWTKLEIDYAMSIGCNLVAVHHAIVWSETRRVFAPLMTHLWALREPYLAAAERAKKVGDEDAESVANAWATWLKFYANSLTGRLAIRPDSEIIIFGHKGGRLHCPMTGWCKDMCTRRCGILIPLGTEGGACPIYTRQIWRIADSAHVHWAAYLTAYARVELHRQLVADGEEGRHSVYCDTDSVYTTVERTGPEINATELGHWKYEGQDRYFESLAPKTYCRGDGTRFTVKAKGIPKADRAKFLALKQGEAVDLDGVMGLRSGVMRKGQVFVRLEMARALHNTVDEHGTKWYGDRWLGDDGRTYPPHISEVRA